VVDARSSDVRNGGAITQWACDSADNYQQWRVIAVNGDNHVAIVDLKTWAVTKKLQTGTGPDGMAWIE